MTKSPWPRCWDMASAKRKPHIFLAGGRWDAALTAPAPGAVCNVNEKALSWALRRNYSEKRPQPGWISQDRVDAVVMSG